MQGYMIIQLQNYDKPQIFISEVHLFNIITDLIPTAFFSYCTAAVYNFMTIILYSRQKPFFYELQRMPFRHEVSSEMPLFDVQSLY